ncbi:MAG: hypothetical protein KI791_17830 [Cyclobacteriaceae bacterium]|nr:hypothetical protein [Cyclobacteriaceae bacterium SS2]
MIIDLSTIIITAIFIVAIFGPIAYLIWKGQNRLHESIRNLKAIEKDHQLNCTVLESWSDKAIGLDSQNKKLIFVDIQPSPLLWKLIDLKKVANCKVIDAGEVIQLAIGEGSKVDLLTFFNIQTDDPVDRGFHLVLAKKWAQLIDKNITKHEKSPRRAA